MKPISYFIDCPAIQKAMTIWGQQFENLQPIDRCQILEILAYAGRGLIATGELRLNEAEELGFIWDWDESQVGEFLDSLNQELTSLPEVALLIHAISWGLTPNTITIMADAKLNR